MTPVLFLHPGQCRSAREIGGVAASCSAIAGLLLVLLVFASDVMAEGYTVGVVPQFNTRRMFRVWQPILEALEQSTGHKFNLALPLTIPQFEQEIEKGTYDFLYANPYHIMRVNPRQNYIPLVRDQAPLRGILVVRKDSPVNNIKELEGKRLAIPSPNALGASLLLRADLARFHGVSMESVNCKTHSSVYLNVVNRLTDAGGGVQKTLSEQEERVKGALRVLYTTRDMPSHPVAAHERVAENVRKDFRRAFLELAATPAGMTMLEEVPMQTPVPASLDEYLAMRAWQLEDYWVAEGQ